MQRRWNKLSVAAAVTLIIAPLGTFFTAPLLLSIIDISSMAVLALPNGGYFAFAAYWLQMALYAVAYLLLFIIAFSLSIAALLPKRLEEKGRLLAWAVLTITGFILLCAAGMLILWSFWPSDGF